MQVSESSERSPTANERFKSRSEDWVTMGFIAAVFAHFALFALFPTLTAEDIDFAADEIAMVELPPDVKIPPPPEQIARTDFESNPIENLLPPPTGGPPV